ncbi:hypothetical protein [Dongia sp. agr-C8]
MKPKNGSIVEDPVSWVQKLGGLHDVRIESAEFITDAQSLTLTLNDLNGNFTGLPEYEGFRPAALIFREAKSLFFDIDLTDGGVRISNLLIEKTVAGFRLGIQLNIGIGSASEVRPSIISEFTALVIRDLQDQNVRS